MANKQTMILDLAIQGKTRREAFDILHVLTLDGIEPMVFTRNPTASEKMRGEYGRKPKDMATQLIELRHQVNRTYAANGYADDGTLAETETETSEVKVKPAEIVPAEKPVKAAGKGRIRDELDFFRTETIRLRRYCNEKAEQGRPVDEISTRPDEAAGKLIPRGIPARALLASMTFHWNRTERQDARIENYDFEKLSREISAERNLEAEWTALCEEQGDVSPEPLHVMFAYALVLAEARQPIYLYGPKGTGKSHLARQIARFNRMKYAETPMSLGASRGDLLGKFTASSEKPFITASFSDVYENGGVFSFEEFDAADPGMIIVLNNALAGSEFHNSNSGKVLHRSENFIAMANGNTLANGDKSIYNREALDPATLDRWNMGRIHMRHDQAVSDFLLYRYV